MRYKITITGMDAIADKLNEAAREAEKAVAQEIAKDTDQFVPVQTGALSNGAKVKENEVIYPGPYARMLYYGKLLVNPTTGSAWASKGATKVPTNQDLVFNRTSHRLAQSHWFEASKAVNKDKWQRDIKKAL